MSGMKDLLGSDFYESRYPRAPGFKEKTTSREAAKSIAPDASKIRAAVLRVIEASPLGVTADECAGILNLSVLSVRPRVSELRKSGSIRKNNIAGHMRRKNESGQSAIVWVKA